MQTRITGLGRPLKPGGAFDGGGAGGGLSWSAMLIIDLRVGKKLISGYVILSRQIYLHVMVSYERFILMSLLLW